MKTCRSCHIKKAKTLFYKSSEKKDGLQNYCKDCMREKDKEYSLTKKGLVSRTYGTQRASSKKRNHPMPTYTKRELKEWMYSQPLFHKLYDNWKRLDFQTDYRPSVDRKNDLYGYSIENIQLMTWEENNLKGYETRQRGIH